MTERPIIFSVPMVSAILDGRKTMTRRVVKLRDPSQTYSVHDDDGWPMSADDGGDWHRDRCPYGQPGDRLWVREVFAVSKIAPQCQVAYAADGKCVAVGWDGSGGYMQIFHGWLLDAKDRRDRPGDTFGRSKYKPWRSPIHMPRWASRITLEIAGVRVERLQAITEEDAIAEGVDAIPIAEIRRNGCFTRRDDFCQLWHKLNGKKHPWASNPWVWVVSFK